MMEVLCQCDWDLGVELPAHQHILMEHVIKDDGTYDHWWNNCTFQSCGGWDGYTVIDTVEEIRFSVPWKELYREWSHKV